MGEKTLRGKNQKISVSGRIKSENTYYLHIADRYRAAGFLLLILFVVFAAVMLVKFGSSVTYDNLVYLARDFKGAMGTSTETISSVSFTSQENMTFSFFRDGAAVAGSGEGTLYGPSGEEVFSYSESFPTPVLTSSDKYLLAYSPGGKYYSLYNSVTRLFSKETGGEIIAADVGDSGAYVTVTRVAPGKYDVEIFGDDLNRIMTVHKDKHVTDVAISPDGKTVAIASAVEGNVDFSSEIYVVEAGKEEPVARLNYPSSLPFAVDFTSAGVLFAAFDDRIVFYDSSMEIGSSTDFESLAPACYGVSEGGVTVACRENVLGTRTRVFSFDTAGNLIYNETVSSRVTEVAAPRDPAACAGFVKTGEEIIKLALSGNNLSERYSGDVFRIIDVGDGLLVCTGSRIYKLFSEEVSP